MNNVEHIQQNEDAFKTNLDNILTQDMENFSEVNQLSNYVSKSFKKAVVKTLSVDRKTTTNDKITKDTKKLIADRNKHKIFMTHDKGKETNLSKAK